MTKFLTCLKLAKWQKIFASKKLVSSRLKSYTFFYLELGIRMINLSLNELNLITKNRDINDYENNKI